MSQEDKIVIISAIITIGLLVGSIFFTATPIGVAVWNNWFHTVQKADDATNYETRKRVEDSCRAMVASYEADRLTWEMYKDSEKAEEVSWANQARMRANRTAANYNNYILENSYVWIGNVPADIYYRLEVLGE